MRMAMWLALTPLVWAPGVVNVPLASGIAGALAVAAGLVMAASRRKQLSGTGLRVVMVATTIGLIGVAAVFGSFLVVPGPCPTPKPSGRLCGACGLRMRSWQARG